MHPERPKPARHDDERLRRRDELIRRQRALIDQLCAALRVTAPLSGCDEVVEPLLRKAAAIPG